MRILLTVLSLLALLTAPVMAQDDDKGFIASFLEDTLAGDGRTVQINGFRGVLSRRATVDSIVILDNEGPWLRMDDLALQLNRAALLKGRVEIEELSAVQIELFRPPIPPETNLPPAEAQGFSLPELPVSIDIKLLKADKIKLGQPILGEPAELTLTAALSLINGEALAKLSAERIDKKRGLFNIDAGFDSGANIITLNLDLQEGEGGIAARLLELPGNPSTDLSIIGIGPLDDFSADLKIATDGRERLAGTVALSDVPVEDGSKIQKLAADINGDVTALFAPQYRPFFGEDISLKLDGSRSVDGHLDLEALDLKTEALRLQGQVSLNPDYWPTKFQLTGQIGNREGTFVTLPISGPETKVRDVDLDVSYDAQAGDRWMGDIRILDLDRDGLSVEGTQLTADGTLSGQISAIGQVTAALKLGITGIAFEDPAIAAAVGTAFTGVLDVDYTEGRPLKLSGLNLAGTDYRLTGSAQMSDLSNGLKTAFDTKLAATDISRFSSMAGRTLGGSVDLAIAGTADLGGTFDLSLSGNTQELSIDQDPADKLLRGRSTLEMKAKRDQTGTTLENLIIQNDQFQFAGSATIDSAGADVELDTTLFETALLSSSLRGSASVSGMARQRNGEWSIDVNATGPFSSKAEISGPATGPDTKLQFKASLPDLSVLVPKINGPLQAQGEITKQSADRWGIATRVDGPAGTNANVQGSVASSGRLELDTVGTAPLSLANPFISPRSLDGGVSFDLSVNGPAALSSVNGIIKIRNGTAVAPNLKFGLQQIDGDVALASDRATIDLRANASSGGRLTVTGPVGLGGSLPSNLRIALDSVVVEDPTLYKTAVDGLVAIDGSLLANARISGEINVGETLITVPSSGISSFGTIPHISHVDASPPVRRTLRNAGLLSSETSGSGDAGPAFPLDITINAPQRIFVRGRGLDAELGGRLRLTGTTRTMISAGRIELVRGRLDILSKRFELDEGIVQLQGDLDPFLRFVATTETDVGSASVVVEGSASDPQVRFESNPEAPQDEVLSQIFFGRDVSQISALQALQLASAVATLAGRGGEGVVSKLRRGFDLDDLDITTDEQGNAGLRAGKYISENIYTDVTIGAETGPEVSLNIDLTPTIKATGKLGSDGDTSLGIYFEKDY